MEWRGNKVTDEIPFQEPKKDEDKSSYICVPKSSSFLLFLMETVTLLWLEFADKHSKLAEKLRKATEQD